MELIASYRQAVILLEFLSKLNLLREDNQRIQILFDSISEKYLKKMNEEFCRNLEAKDED